MRWVFPFSLLVLTLFGVFVLPFLLPPPYLAGVSAANVAGFNNKVSALAAAALGVAVFLFYCRWPWKVLRWQQENFGPLPLRLVVVTVAICASIDACLCTSIAVSRLRFYDASYFVDQISDYLDYGRKLYDQIEFPYGPILFYGPVVMHQVLSPWHVSLTAAYFVTLVAEHMVGLLLVAYVLNSLPILRNWKIVFFLVCAPVAIPFSFGLNYTFFRALGSVALLVAATRLTSLWQVSVCMALGQMVSLGISPEMGFAFAAAGVVYIGYRVLTAGWAWLSAIGLQFLGGTLFFVLAGPGYLRMLKLFAHGVYNFVVEPLPHILLFLFAVVWLVPVALAQSLRSKEPRTPLLIALYVFSLALLPVAFGRADAGHVLFNGITLYMLSFVAIGSYSPRIQKVWVGCVACILLWTFNLDLQPTAPELRHSLSCAVANVGSDTQAQSIRSTLGRISPSIADRLRVDRSLDDAQPVMNGLRKAIGHEAVVTPEAVGWNVQQALKQSGQYKPTIYDFQTAVLDSTAEARAIEEFNTSKWALILKGSDSIYTETPATSASALGFDLPYRNQHAPYFVGLKFKKNLEENWEPYGEVGDYEIYRHR